MDTTTVTEYQEAIQRLDSFMNFERNPAALSAGGFGTERMANLMRRIGSPHLTMPAVHIAGTKGKGSTAHLVAAALTASKIMVGLYTSPHVNDLRERIVIGRRPVNERRFALAARTALKAAEDMRADGHEPSYFEVLTAIAFQFFHNAGVEVVVLEAGLGGRLDATNLPDLPVLATGISSISRDHEDILGADLPLIAAEKAGIIRRNVPVATSVTEPGALDVIIKTAAAMESPLFRVGEDVRFSRRENRQPPPRPERGQRIDFETWRALYPDVSLGLLGDHQAENAALALALVELFMDGSSRGPLDGGALRSGWRNLAIPARMEILGGRPRLVVDGGHNPSAAWAVAEAVAGVFPAERRVLVFGSAADKDSRTMLRILAPLFDRIVFSAYDSPRAKTATELMAELAELGRGDKGTAAESPARALELARGLVPDDGLILAFGSFYLAGEVRSAALAAERDSPGKPVP
ncbi:MAG: bifunctional folylpolyglutamate synthase/dihydrofolate synthase [Planctomycetota bacterium]|jgi:dihydrofolate synthase/folylpolyglutamate synthase|nr:bifunctional folylpolyglutamate synthase/dihydrofolate synthase [Planctomycetota bacterium]